MYPLSPSCVQQILRMHSRTKKAAQGGSGTTSSGSDTSEDTYVMFRHTLKMLEIASLLLRPDSSLWLLRMRINSQPQLERSARGVFGDMLRIACSAFPSYRSVDRVHRRPRVVEVQPAVVEVSDWAACVLLGCVCVAHPPRHYAGGRLPEVFKDEELCVQR